MYMYIDLIRVRVVSFPDHIGLRSGTETKVPYK